MIRDVRESWLRRESLVSCRGLIEEIDDSERSRQAQRIGTKL